MSTPPPLPPSDTPPNMGRMVFAAFMSNLATGIVYGLLIALNDLAQSHSIEWANAILIPSLLLVPFFSGMLMAWMCRHIAMRILDVAIATFLGTGICIAGGAVVLREGAVCLLMAAPLLWLFIFLGALVGRARFRPDRSKLNLCLLPLIPLLALGEMETRTYEKEVVVDQVLIHAPPEKVWPHVLAFPEISDKPDYWIFRLGLPYPVATTNTGNFVGADRQCIFSDGVTLKETVAAFEPNRRLTFDIVEQPTHPEAYGHIILHRGQFDLRDNGDGTTTLVGSSWYTLRVRPLFYFDWWTRDMTRAVHLRVMRHVQRLSEAS